MKNDDFVKNPISASRITPLALRQSGSTPRSTGPGLSLRSSAQTTVCGFTTSKICILLVAGLCVALLAGACAPRTRPSAAPRLPSRAAEELFHRAEEQYANQAFAKALVLYEEVLSRFPEDPVAPGALMKIGRIYAIQGDPVQARRAFARLLADYPSSDLRPAAMLEVLDSLLRDRRYREVLSRGGEALDMMGSAVDRSRALALIGDAHMALEESAQAVDAYFRSLTLAAPSDQDAAAAKLKAALLRLGPTDVVALAEKPSDGMPMDYLLYQAGMLFAREGRQSDALVLLKAFRNRYPRHVHSAQAEAAIADIEATARGERHILGCLLPLTGAYQTIGQRALRGLELAISQIDSRGGAPAVHMIVKDTASDPDKTLAALQELAAENVSAVIGPIVHAEAAAPEAQRLRIPMIAITQKDGVVGVGDYVFRNFITPRAQVRSLVDFVLGRLGVTKAVALYPDELYGRTFSGLFREEFQAAGGELLTASAYSPDATDFSVPIKRLLRFAQVVPRENTEERPPVSGGSRRRKADEDKVEVIPDFKAIFIPDEPRKAAMLIPQLFYHDIKNVQLIGTNLWHSDALIRNTEAYVQGAIMPDAFFAGSQDPLVRRFVASFEEAYKEPPGFIEAIVYDSAMILFQVASQPGVRFRGDVAAALRFTDGFAGVSGLTRFDASGDSVKKLHILQIRGKQFIELE